MPQADGQAGVNELIRNGERCKLPGKVELELEAGDLIRISTPGGGGWGEPGERSMDELREDVADGLVTQERANKVYREQKTKS